MRLLPIPDESGKPTLYINPDHVVSVQGIFRQGPNGCIVAAELKVDGMPLQRIPLGEHFGKEDAEAAFLTFMGRLQGDTGHR